MIKYLKFQLKLNKLFREKEKIAALFATHLEELRKANASLNKIENLYHEERTELNIIEYEIENLTTSYFMRLARTKFIEIPEWNDEKSWVESSLDPNGRVLSNSAISELRSKIMRYRKERNEQLVPVITAITGLTGAAIGVIALFISKA